MKDKLVEMLQKGEIELTPTQNKICYPIVERIYRKMKIKLMFSGISVADGLIINGHHRYLASLLAGYSLDKVPGIKSAAKNIHEWKSVELVDEDWDTKSKIDMLNEDDAKYNNLSLEGLIELLKK